VNLLTETPPKVQSTGHTGLQWKNLLVGLGVLVGLAGGAILILLLAPTFHSKPSHQLILRACFHDAEGVQNDSRVRLAGVDVGHIRRVRAMPRSPHCPAEVEMLLETDYELRIPEDSVADIRSDGVLGAKYIEIDASKADGVTAVDGSILRTVEPTTITPEQWFKVLQRLAQGPGREEKHERKPGVPEKKKMASERPSPSKAE
jgi:ABC-type transporter Mla subunit MlaD